MPNRLVNDLFRNQLTLYATYHRDARNCATHYIGIPLLFLSVLLPLALWRVQIGGVVLTAATFMTALGLVGWMLLDRVVGLALVLAVIPFILLAEWIAWRFGATAAWLIALALFVVGWAFQIVGHAAFERRRPAAIDNLFQAFIGPMFIMAKALVALGLRPDLAKAMNASRVTDSAGP
jgi:uncharacterized membrane protein YGL010W